MSHRLTLLILIAMLAGAATPVLADLEVEGNDNGAITVTHSDPGTLGAPGAHGGSGPAVYSYHALDWSGPGGAICLGSYYTTDRALADLYERGEAIRRQLGHVDPPPCPSHGPTPPVATPGTLAQQFWDVRVLPAPTPKVVPDYGIVGKRVFLQIGGEPAKTFTVPDPLGPTITITAASHYVVDWGDGTTTETTSQGGPYPHGDITHVYGNDAPSVTIRVRQRWSATWSAGGPSSPLDPLQTAGSLPFRVVQVQAVRNG